MATTTRKADIRRMEKRFDLYRARELQMREQRRRIMTRRQRFFTFTLRDLFSFWTQKPSR